MTARFTVRDVAVSDLASCASLLSSRHRRDRSRNSLLPSAFESTEQCLEILQSLFHQPATDGAVAEIGSEIVAFMFGQQSLHAADHWLAQYFPPRVIGIPLHGHAGSNNDSIVPSYRALYGHLADRWTASGFFDHRVDFAATDEIQRELWFELGFGALTKYAGRKTTSIDSNPIHQEITIRQAMLEDHAEVERLEKINSRFHHLGPVLWPFLWKDVRESASGLSKYALSRDRHAIFLATRQAETLGMQILFSGMAFGPQIATREQSVYLFHAIVESNSRGEGVGRALLKHALDWAHDSGHSTMTLHYAAMNQVGESFWENHGFETIVYSAGRHIDERLSWARP